MEGRIIGQRYRLLEQIGKGGMGSVWRAEHLTLRTHVAVKIIGTSIAESPQALTRFKHEAQAAAELRSTHIVQVFDYGVDEGLPYIAMELLEGESLRDRMKKCGPLASEQVALIFSQLARALSRAHERGVVHRDLKPENIQIVREGDHELCKVLDFGVAKKLSGPSVDTTGFRTGTGALLGTPFYMSPEQALGQTDIDYRTDIWSFAIMAFECLTGQRPFVRDSLGKLIMAICRDPIPKPSDLGAVPPGFDEWFAHATMRDPAQRYQTATEAMLALQPVLDGSWQPTHSVSDFQPPSSADPPQTAPSVSVNSEGMGSTASPASRTIADPARPSPRSKTKYWVLAAVAFGTVAAFFAMLRPKPSPAPVTSLAEASVSRALTAAPVDVSVSVAPSALVTLGTTSPSASSHHPNPRHAAPTKAKAAAISTATSSGRDDGSRSHAPRSATSPLATSTQQHRNAAGF